MENRRISIADALRLCNSWRIQSLRIHCQEWDISLGKGAPLRKPCSLAGRRLGEPIPGRLRMWREMERSRPSDRSRMGAVSSTSRKYLKTEELPE